MAENEDVERVARAIAVQDGKNPDAMSHNSFHWWRHYVPQARAAIAAMPERGIESKGVKLAFVYAFAAGFKAAEETSRQCIPAMDDAWDEYQQIPTPPEPTT